MTWRDWLWLDHWPLLDVLSEREIADSLRIRTGQVDAAPIHPPIRYPDGSTDERSRDLDVITASLFAPASDKEGAE